jgi:hypothetical protein
MKMWRKPQMTDLSVRYTEHGGLGGSIDGVVFQVKVAGKTFLLFGTSGPEIDHPNITRKP